MALQEAPATALPPQALFRQAQATHVLSKLVGYGPGSPIATASARALLVLAYDYEKLQDWL
jgi:hypothetical protein